MSLDCQHSFFCLKMASYQVRASFGKLEFTGCEINHLHIGAKPTKKKKKTFKIVFRSPGKNICVHIYTQINMCVCLHTSSSP